MLKQRQHGTLCVELVKSANSGMGKTKTKLVKWTIHGIHKTSFLTPPPIAHATMTKEQLVKSGGMFGE